MEDGRKLQGLDYDDSDFDEPYKYIDEFLTTIDVSKIIKEIMEASDEYLFIKAIMSQEKIKISPKI